MTSSDEIIERMNARTAAEPVSLAEVIARSGRTVRPGRYGQRVAAGVFVLAASAAGIVALRTPEPAPPIAAGGAPTIAPAPATAGTAPPPGPATTAPQLVDGRCAQDMHHPAAAYVREHGHPFRVVWFPPACTMVVASDNLTDADKDKIRELAGGPVQFWPGTPGNLPLPLDPEATG